MKENSTLFGDRISRNFLRKIKIGLLECESEHRFTLGRHLAEETSPPPGGNRV